MLVGVTAMVAGLSLLTVQGTASLPASASAGCGQGLCCSPFAEEEADRRSSLQRELPSPCSVPSLQASCWCLRGRSVGRILLIPNVQRPEANGVAARTQTAIGLRGGGKESRSNPGSPAVGL